MGEAWACLLLRLWVGTRLLFAGITKWKKPDGEYSKDWMLTKMGAIKDQMIANNPEMPVPMVNMFTSVLPYALVIVGALIIIGLFTRISLVLGGFVFLSLAFGLMLLPDDTEVIYRGVEILLTAGALALVRYNILAADNVIGFILPSKSKDKDDEDDDDDED